MFQIVTDDNTVVPFTGYRAIMQWLQAKETVKSYANREMAVQRETKDGWKTFLVVKVPQD